MRSMLIASLCMTACGGGPATLDGSLTEVCDVSYSRATLEATDGFLALRFLQARGAVEDTVLKVGVVIDGKVPDHPIQYDLAEMVNGAQRGVASRNVLADPEHTIFPLLLRGALRVDGDLASAKGVRGQVSLTFVQGNVLGSGRAVFGSFEAEVLR